MTGCPGASPLGTWDRPWMNSSTSLQAGALLSGTGIPKTVIQDQYYWGGQRVAYYSGGSLHFQHQDWMGTEHIRSSYNGGSDGQFTSLPFGDDLTTTGGTDTDAYHFAQIDHDYESDTEHAQFRQYSSAQGRFLSPDPYGGSYDPSNPQSFNRYAYALNNPLSNVDPSGQDACATDNGDGTTTIVSATDGGAVDCFGNGSYIITNQIVTGVGFDSNGDLSVYGANGNLYNPDGSAYDPSQTITVSANGNSNYLGLPMFSSSLSYIVPQIAPNNGTPVHGPWTYGNHCGPGGMGPDINGTDAACHQHDDCYNSGGFTPGSNFQGHNAQLQACNQQLCNAARARLSSLAIPWLPSLASTSALQEAEADREINFYFTWVVAPGGDSCH
jgi:RHS repeat-associated protein